MWRDRLATAVLATTVILFAAAPHAAAATTYTPTGGPATDFVAKGLTVTLIEPGQTIKCTQVSVRGPVLSPSTPRAYGADSVSLDSFGATGCTHPVMGTTAITALTSPTLAIVGDVVSGMWPAQMKNVVWKVVWANCVFYLGGTINGRFDPAAQTFTPGSGAVGLTILSTPAPPTGGICATFDLWVGDTVALGGSFVDIPPAGSTGLTISNP